MSALEVDMDGEKASAEGKKVEYAEDQAKAEDDTKEVQVGVNEKEWGREGPVLDVESEAEVARARKSLHEPITLITTSPSLDSHPADALHPPDSPTTSLITSLRSQLRLLTEQAEQLNGKLITSISHGADLEDSLFGLEQSHAEQKKAIEALERKKAEYEESMNTGLLVERSQIRDEMQRLAAGLVEEERRRGSAEEGRLQVENEVDNLTATLFDQSTEDNLAAAESAVRDMQLHLQSLPVNTLQPSPPVAVNVERHLLASHLPYTEFLAFLHHLRSLRPLRETSKALFPPPLVANLLTQGFLNRLTVEDHDPTLRLEAAPDLGFLSRRYVGQAIIAGELIIEPVSAASVIASSSLGMNDIGCALCGRLIFGAPHSPHVGGQFAPPPNHPAMTRAGSSSASRFSLKPFFNTTSAPAPTSPSASPLSSPAPGASTSGNLSSVYIFRITKPPATGINTVASQTAEKEAKFYPLCKNGWCLERLRATCALWHFVRTGIIHVVWQGDDGYTLQSEMDSASEPEAPLQPPPLPQRKKSSWGLGFKLADRTNGTGWTKAFKGIASPPASPGLSTEGKLEESAAEGEELVIVDLDQKEKGGEVKEGLGAPLELDEATVQPEQAEAEEKSEEHAEKETPSVVPEPHTSSPKLLLAPELHRSTSSNSVSGSERDEVVSFSTPTGTPLELSDVELEAETPKVHALEPLPQTIDLASPKVAAPPIPKRAAGRNRPSAIEGGSGSATPERGQSPSPLPASPAKPPLPPRHPQTPTQALETPTTQPGDRMYLSQRDLETFEGKTWKMVVKLKEEMWRARVGVKEE
ncbi:Rab guanine nucleotide exchange factor SEC2, partial [Tremellales sp. Uapishka_1]